MCTRWLLFGCHQFNSQLFRTKHYTTGWFSDWMQWWEINKKKHNSCTIQIEDENNKKKCETFELQKITQKQQTQQHQVVMIHRLKLNLIHDKNITFVCVLLKISSHGASKKKEHENSIEKKGRKKIEKRKRKKSKQQIENTQHGTMWCNVKKWIIVLYTRTECIFRFGAVCSLLYAVCICVWFACRAQNFCFLLRSFKFWNNVRIPPISIAFCCCYSSSSLERSLFRLNENLREEKIIVSQNTDICNSSHYKFAMCTERWTSKHGSF